MSHSEFRPFETHLEQKVALDILRQATHGADDGELFFERRSSETLMLDDQRLKSANFDASEGFGLRAVCGEVTGYAHSTEISEAAVRRAQSTVQLATHNGVAQLAQPPARTNTHYYAPIDPTDEISFSAKVDVLKEIDDYVRSLDARVVQVTAMIAVSVQEVTILRPEGGEWSDIRPMSR